MAARRGVRCLFGSYVKHFYSAPRLCRTFYLSVPKHASHTMQPNRKIALFNNILYKVHNRDASTAVQTEEPVSGCPICSRNLTFTYKSAERCGSGEMFCQDVLLLAQFISPEGNILNRRITGVCRKQQRKLEKAIEISRRLGLIPRKPPALMHNENEMT